MENKVTKIEVLKSDDEKRLIYGIVLKPDVADAHGDLMEVSEIEKSAHNYLMFYREAGEEHRQRAEAVIVESYLAPVDFIQNNREVKKGAWVVAMKVLDDTLWLKVKTGSLNAFSAGGYARRENIK